MSIVTTNCSSLPYGLDLDHSREMRTPTLFIPSAIRQGIETMPRPTPPASHQDLLDRPLFAHLATVRPDGAPQSGLMWFAWDGERARFSHTRTRQKVRNLAHEPRLSFH